MHSIAKNHKEKVIVLEMERISNNFIFTIVKCFKTGKFVICFYCFHKNGFYSQM